MGIYPEFERPKIVYPDIASRCEFACDGDGRYSSNTIPNLGQVSIPDAPPTERQAIERLVRRLLALQGVREEAEALEQELNERVHRLFSLTEAEIALIEERLGRSAAG